MSTAVAHRPRETDEVLALLARYGEDARLLAGGTAFMILRRSGLLPVGHVVSCTAVGEHRAVGVDRATDPGIIHIGALASLRSIETSAEVRAHLPVAARALRLVANLRVRNAATIGGNLAEGDPTSDLPTVLSALDTSVRLDSVEGSREVGLHEFFVDHFETATAATEFLTGVSISLLPSGWHGSYLKFSSRNADDRTCLGVAAFVRVDEHGTCAGIRVAVAGACGVPLRLPDTEQAFAGRSLDDVGDFANEYARAADPISDVRGSREFRLKLIRPLIERAVRDAASGYDAARLA